jgi:ATP-dependent DNA helicase Rep
MTAKALNPQQLEARNYIDGPLLVLAGAGSGKTSVITEKIAHLIQNCGYKPASILAVTFTNKAAKEMKERVIKRLEGQKTRGLQISTFHTLGLNILKKEIHALGYKSNFTLFDDQDSNTLIHELSYDAFQASKELTKQIKHQISLWKNALLAPSEISGKITSELERQSHEIYQLYSRYLRAYNAVDFDDLIYLSAKLLKKYPAILQKWQNKFHYILVDEYQDTNISQYQFIKQLIGTRKQITVVGDDDQSIYSWRGAQPENLKILKDDFPNLKVIKLEQNYRSSARILKAANTLIANNPHVFEKKLWSNLGVGEMIRILTCTDEHNEAHRISSEILSHKFQNKTLYSDYAILYRSNHQAFLIEKQLQLYRIPYHISGGTSFFSRTEIKDILAYLKLIMNHDDECAFLRVINTPRREIGPATLERLGAYAMTRDISMFAAIDEMGLTQHLNTAQTNHLRSFKNIIENAANQILSVNITVTALEQYLKELVDTIHYRQWLIDNSSSLKQAERRFDNVKSLIEFICNAKQKSDESEDDLSFSDIINRLLILDLIDNQEEAQQHNKVQLLTLHAAKGLEYPNVYILGMEEGILPHQQSIDEDDIEEERRLAYVGITRAMHTLTLTLCKNRSRYGEKQSTTPSRFLNELPDEDIEWQGKTPTTDIERKEVGRQKISDLRALLGKKD